MTVNMAAEKAIVYEQASNDFSTVQAKRVLSIQKIVNAQLH